MKHSSANLRKKNMFKIGITGGIGSGKSTVCRIMEERGVPVYYADEQARVILNNDALVQEQVTALLGPVYVDGKLDRKLVSQMVFGDDDKREALNALLRPAIVRDFQRWVRSQHAGYVLFESAILIDSGGHNLMDHVVVVTAYDDVRLERAMKRDNALRQQIESRMAAQMSEHELLEHADSIITNNGNEDALMPQVMALCCYLDEVAGSEG